MIRRAILTLAPALLLLSGCIPEFTNAPSKEHAVSLSQLEGNFYYQANDGQRYDVSIKKTSNAMKPYEAKLSKGVFGIPNDVTIRVRPYKIGDAYFVVVFHPQDDSRLNILRLELSRTQLALRLMKTKYFKDNMAAIPSTALVDDPDNKGQKIIRVSATPQQVSGFLSLHADNRDLFDQESKMLLNRVGG